MDKQADIGLVDAHAESDGRRDDRDVVANEPLLRCAPHAVVKPGVVWLGVEAVGAQARSQVFGLSARSAIDDGRLTLVLPEQLRQRTECVLRLGEHGIAEIGAVEAGDELLRPVQAQLLDDVLAHPLGGRRRQRQERHARQAAPQFAQLAIVGPKVMPPHRDAVRLVHGHKTDFETGEKVLETRLCQPLRRDVQNLECALLRPCLDAIDLGVRERAVDERRLDAV